MKKIVALLISIMMVFSLVACGNQSGENQSGHVQTAPEDTTPEILQVTREPSNETDTEKAAEPAAETSEEAKAEVSMEPASTGAEDEAGKTLVVYYSATGHTEDVAGYIAAATEADMLALEPVEPYSADDLNWSDENSRVVYEHDNPDARVMELVEATVDDWESYDTVFIGYPIWWGIAAWPVDAFIAANDFTGKTVIPFCTSSSSGLGESGELLAEAAGTGDWLEGERFTSSVSEAAVQEWVAGLGL